MSFDCNTHVCYPNMVCLRTLDTDNIHVLLCLTCVVLFRISMENKIMSGDTSHTPKTIAIKKECGWSGDEERYWLYAIFRTRPFLLKPKNVDWCLKKCVSLAHLLLIVSTTTTVRIWPRRRPTNLPYDTSTHLSFLRGKFFSNKVRHNVLNYRQVWVLNVTPVYIMT